MTTENRIEGLAEILLVEDNLGDIFLIRETLASGRIWNHLNVVRDGIEAMAYLQQQGDFSAAVRPDLILLDLNLPRKDGREVLAEIKTNENLKHIPVVILTTSQAQEDVLQAYELHANCYISKPVDVHKLSTIVQSIEDFWFAIVKLPSR
jgi:CheY-like chemotaxis protein